MGMKRKTIKAVLAKKFNSFLSNIADETIKDLIAKNSIITGGAIASMLLGEEVNDFDIYFRTKAVALEVAKYYVEVFQAIRPAKLKFRTPHVVEEDDRIVIRIKYDDFEADTEEEDVAKNMETAEAAEEVAQGTKKTQYRPVFLSPNCISLSGGVQLIVRFYGEPDQIHENYDFVHCTNYWTSWDRNLCLRSDAMEAILAKDLRYIGSRYPICSLMRMRKFINRGWKINAGQIVKMAWQINRLDLKDSTVLEEQLIGVDTAYFNQLIDRLKKNTDTEVVEGTYLFQLIDEIF